MDSDRMETQEPRIGVEIEAGVPLDKGADALFAYAREKESRYMTHIINESIILNTQALVGKGMHIDTSDDPGGDFFSAPSSIPLSMAVETSTSSRYNKLIEEYGFAHPEALRAATIVVDGDYFNPMTSKTNGEYYLGVVNISSSALDLTDMGTKEVLEVTKEIQKKFPQNTQVRIVLRRPSKVEEKTLNYVYTERKRTVHIFVSSIN